MGKHNNNNNKIKYRGVKKYKNGWVARLSHLGILHKSKVFLKKKEAAKSYDRFAKQYHKKYAILNFKTMATLDTPTPEQGTIGMSTLQTGSIALVGIVMIAGILGHFVRRAFDSPSMYFPQWIAVWLAISTLICTWDASFVLNRETSIDSFNNPIWMPYQDYVKVDQLYGKVNDDFVWSQSILNIVEICINILALYLLSKKEFKQASVTALVACAMTSSKTVLYHVMEYSACSESHGIEGCNTNQNDSAKFWIM